MIPYVLYCIYYYLYTILFNLINIYKRLYRKATFVRVVRGIAAEVGIGIDGNPLDPRFTGRALEALQSGTESFLTEILADSNLCAIHANRVTIMQRDFELLRNLKIIEKPL